MKGIVGAFSAARILNPARMTIAIAVVPKKRSHAELADIYVWTAAWTEPSGQQFEFAKL
jgi:hypothetical protein